MGELMKTDRCTDCEFGKGFIELCECPVCHASMILGDVTTRQIHCPNGCAHLPFAVDFCAARIFVALREKREVSGSVNIFDAVRLSEYLEEQNVEYKVLPGLPVISRIWECWDINGIA